LDEFIKSEEYTNLPKNPPQAGTAKQTLTLEHDIKGTNQEIKTAIKAATQDEAEKLAQKALKAETGKAVRGELLDKGFKALQGTWKGAGTAGKVGMAAAGAGTLIWLGGKVIGFFKGNKD